MKLVKMPVPIDLLEYGDYAGTMFWYHGKLLFLEILKSIVERGESQDENLAFQPEEKGALIEMLHYFQTGRSSLISSHLKVAQSTGAILKGVIYKSRKSEFHCAALENQKVDFDSVLNYMLYPCDKDGNFTFNSKGECIPIYVDPLWVGEAVGELSTLPALTEEKVILRN